MSLDHLINSIVDQFGDDTIPGWCPLDKALDLAMTVVALRPKVVLEIGVFGGKSLLPMAMACEAVKTGTVIGIDPWSASASVEGYSGENASWWSKLDHEGIYRGFVENTKRLGLENRVAIERAKSDDAAVPAVIDLLHIDGQHAEQAIREADRFGSHVRIGGVVFLDDLGWRNNGVGHVGIAVEHLLNLGFTELYRTRTERGDEWGAFQRTSISRPASGRGSNRLKLKDNRTNRTLAAKRRVRR